VIFLDEGPINPYTFLIMYPKLLSVYL